jgi:hypothetical protein
VVKKLQGKQHIKGKDVAKYVFLPGIVPRTKALFGSGFTWLAYLMAVIYSSVRLLPKNHPYLNPENTGKFTIRAVISEAAKNLKFSKNNIDQIIVFFALLGGFILLIVQFIMLILMAVLRPALAVPPPPANMFDTPDSVMTNDIALTLLDYVFGVPGFFVNSNGVPTALQATLPTPFHDALHNLFQYYSFALLAIAVLIFIYYLFVLVGETAATGSPFGRRFSKVWAPIRLVVALGLLVPINNGLNSAQYIVLMAAKLGSGFATNAWIQFNAGIQAPFTLNNNSLVAQVNTPDLMPINNFLLIASACTWSHIYLSNFTRVPMPYIVSSPNNAQNIIGYPYDDNFGGASALDWYNGDDVKIVFGIQDPQYSKYVGNVRPFCGEVHIHTHSADQYRIGGLSGPLRVQEIYYEMIWRQLWTNAPFYRYGIRAACLGLRMFNEGTARAGICDVAFAVGEQGFDKLPSNEFFVNVMDEPGVGINPLTAADINQARIDMIAAITASGDADVQLATLNRGWGGAGMWYNQISQWNGSFVGAVMDVPTPVLMPEVMEIIKKEKMQANEDTDPVTLYEPILSDGTPINFPENPPKQDEIAKALNIAYLNIMENTGVLEAEQEVQGNILIDLMNIVLGVGGIADLRNNNDVHPLAQLTMIGKGMITSSIKYIFATMGFGFGGGLADAFKAHGLQGAALSAAGFASSFATVGLTVGFILYYVLPFMPFMYFFFAVGGWVKGIFEAMVGVPLWALAHLRIDGEGLPSSTASNGYFLILEIFIRPILTIFGLLASVAIFSALARTLNEIFPLVTVNLTGFNSEMPNAEIVWFENISFKRGIVDEFFFTIVYTILIYLMATASFKMIDLVPNNILRWIGAGVQTFNDQSGDPVAGLQQYAAVGGASIAGEAVGAAQGVSQGVGLTAGNIARLGVTGARSNTVTGP